MKISLRTKITYLLVVVLLVACILLIFSAYQWGKAYSLNYQINVYVVLTTFITILTICMAFIITLYGFGRVDLLLKEITRVQHSHDQSPITVPGNDEISTLANMFEDKRVALSKQEGERNRLISDVAHELRTPMAILHANVEMLITKNKPPSIEKLLPLLDEIKRMTRLIHDLQQLSMSDSGCLRLNKEWINVKDLLEEITSVLHVEADEKNIQIETSFAQLSRDEQELYGDRTRCKQVFINLIGNAINYTPKGGEVCVQVYPITSSNICLTVRDTGAGIPHEKLPYIFNRFYRVDESRDRQSGGMGLGLAIAKEYVEAHGGSVSIDSELNKGTTISVIMPRFPES